MRRKVANLRDFTVSFEKVIKSCLLILAALVGLIETHYKVVRLNVLTMIVYDVARKVRGT